MPVTSTTTLLRAIGACCLTAAFVACGGGTPAASKVPAAAAAPGTASAPGRATALAAGTRATALLDWAEQNHRAYFPSHRSDQFLPPYTYRYYPETGIYLGVADDKVYVMGGPFGEQPAYVGLVADFLPADPETPGGSGNGCWDLDFLEVPGRHIVVESRSTDATGAVISLLRQESRVLGERTFEGKALLATETTITLSLPSGAAASVQRNTSYTQRAAGGGVTLHGDEGVMTAGNVATSFRTVFSPPWTDTQHLLDVGQEVTQTWSGTSTANGVTAPLQGSRTIRFIGRETITVPAGTYATCRFEQTQPGQPAPTTTWIARKWGSPVQLQSAGVSTQALRLTVDGVVVTSSP